MKRPPVLPLLCWTGSAALLAWESLRAARQSITIDEAYAYDLFLRGGLGTALGNFSAAHHGLQTFLSLASISLFGMSEFTLRLPSLIGLGLYLAACALLLFRVFGRTATALLLFAFSVLSPLFLDHFALSRGYGLALAFFALAYFLTLRMLEKDTVARSGPWAAVCLGLSVGSNLVFLFPAAALTGTAALMLLRTGRPIPEVWRLLRDRLCGPAMVLAFCIVAIPFSHAERGSFYFGAATLGETARSLLLLSLHHSDCAPTGYPSCDKYISGAAPYVLVGMIHAAAAFLFYRIWRTRLPWTPQQRFACLAFATHGLNLAAVIAAHGFGTPYPWGRTGIPLLFTFSLCLAAMAASDTRAVRIATLILVGLISLRYGAQTTLGPYGEWRFDAGAREIARHAAQLPQDRPAKVRLEAQTPLLTALEFYWRKAGVSVQVVPAAETADLVIFDAPARQRVANLGFQELYWNSESNTGLGARR